MTTIEIKRTSEFFTSNTDLEDEIAIKKNRWIYLICSIVMAFSVYGVTYKEWEQSTIQIIVAFTFGVMVIIGLGNFFDRSVQLRLSKQGILIQGHKLISWAQINNTLIEIKVESGGDSHSTTYTLIVELSNGKTAKVEISNLNKSVDWIANKVEGFRIKYSNSGLIYKIK